MIVYRTALSVGQILKERAQRSSRLAVKSILGIGVHSARVWLQSPPLRLLRGATAFVSRLPLPSIAFSYFYRYHGYRVPPLLFPLAFPPCRLPSIFQPLRKEDARPFPYFLPLKSNVDFELLIIGDTLSIRELIDGLIKIPITPG
jgi:hypothetical protein